VAGEAKVVRYVGQRRARAPTVEQLQAAYFARGHTEIPPHATVTHARSNLSSRHGYGLAVDVISRKSGRGQPEEWFTRVAENFRSAGCRWGGEWKMKDLPHFQWGLCKPCPWPRALELHAQGGRRAVWEPVGARRQ
jgi:peptidoglycan L-alanyl-D-glutamate endopeptidase CwlK